VAEEYVVHDTGDRKNVTEPAIRQKRIADFFWSLGELSGEIDYQIAEGDLVATRWTLHFQPDTLRGWAMLGEHSLPIINVFRISDGKIVEIWNHRHDIDTGKMRIHWLKGFGVGMVIALALGIYAWRLHRQLKREH
jgi:predicted SnoaL-like aldol condensation-catalyzing enzyme